MKLLLTSNSSFFYKNLKSIFNIPIKDVKLGLITTASKGTSGREYVDRNISEMKELGFDSTEIDIDGKNEKELEILLKDFNFIHVIGGSPFYLLNSVRKSGFDKVVKKLISQGVVYIGSSAGAYITCPNIDVPLWKYNTEEFKDKYDYCGLEDFNAMSLIDFLIVAHYEEYWDKIIKENLPNSKYPIRILKDGQGLLVEDGQVSFWGEGEEVVV